MLQVQIFWISSTVLDLGGNNPIYWPCQERGSHFGILWSLCRFGARTYVGLPHFWSNKIAMCQVLVTINSPYGGMMLSKLWVWLWIQIGCYMDSGQINYSLMEGMQRLEFLTMVCEIRPVWLLEFSDTSFWWCLKIPLGLILWFASWKRLNVLFRYVDLVVTGIFFNMVKSVCSAHDLGWWSLRDWVIGSMKDFTTEDTGYSWNQII